MKNPGGIFGFVECFAEQCCEADFPGSKSEMYSENIAK